MLASLINGAVQVSGADTLQKSRLIGFSNGEHRVMVTKPKVAGFGLNWQHCHNMIFVGLSDSWEQYAYQAIRRCWRFGQTQQVNVFVITADIEGMVVENIKRKDDQSEVMMTEMAYHKPISRISAATKNMLAYQPKNRLHCLILFNRREKMINVKN